MKKEKLLKMKELSAATNVSPGTIRYYIQQGVLPKPVKTHKNMAYYDESYIDRIVMIKQLQKNRFLPLDIIKTILADTDLPPTGAQHELLKEIDKPLYENGLADGDIATLTKGELVAHTGLATPDLEAMLSLELIAPDAEGRFDQGCIRIAEIVAEMRRIGLTETLDFQVEHLQVHKDLIEFLARKEVDLFSKRLTGSDMDRDRTSQLAKEAISAINKLLPILHLRMIQKIFDEAE
jgi:DNA-binding transcriptional MerR regulator